MNDFTKEELDDLRLGINALISEGSCDSTWNADIRALKIKIQSLIENYCEHEKTEFIMDVGIDRCTNCGVTVDD